MGLIQSGCSQEGKEEFKKEVDIAMWKQKNETKTMFKTLLGIANSTKTSTGGSTSGTNTQTNQAGRGGGRGGGGGGRGGGRFLDDSPSFENLQELASDHACDYGNPTSVRVKVTGRTNPVSLLLLLKTGKLSDTEFQVFGFQDANETMVPLAFNSTDIGEEILSLHFNSPVSSILKVKAVNTKQRGCPGSEWSDLISLD